MAEWVEVKASEVSVGDVIDFADAFGRVACVETVKETGHWSSAAKPGHLRIGVEHGRDLFIAPHETVEVYR